MSLSNKNNLINNKIFLTFLFSLLFHSALMLLNFELKQKQVPFYEDKNLIKLDLVDAEEIINRMKVKSDNQKNIVLPNQIVNTEREGVEEKPTDSRFLGEKNQIVDRQTIAEKIDTFNKAGVGEKDKKSIKSTEKLQEKRSQKLAPQKISLENFGVGNLVVQANPLVKEEMDEEVGGLKTGSNDSKGVSSNNDYIEDVQLGDVTKLNTVEFKYYGFYHRIRQKLEQFWGRSLREKTEKLFQSGRTLSGNDDHITSLQIYIDAEGEIIQVLIKGTSGIKELDDAAVESFNQAGPFPNPPKGMLNKDGVAVIKWGFVVKT
jgi:TonB family protein